MAYGGVAPKTIMARRVEAALKGQPLSQATLDKALAAVAEDVNITPNAPGQPCKPIERVWLAHFCCLFARVE